MIPFKPKQTPPLSDAATRQAFVHEAQDAKTLLQKELLVNQAQQQLMQERLRVTKDFLNDLPASDPQYTVIAISIQMDLVELDELKARELIIQQWLLKGENR